MYTRKLPELLAPAGDIECLRAAIWAGADAVYLGCPKYNARASARNFDDESLEQAFSLARLYGVKIYLTFNTLVSEREMDETLEYVFAVCKRFMPDALIVQDIGLAKRIHALTGVPIVASTQMAQHNAYGAELLSSLGVFRIVAAREMTLESVIAMQNESGLEAELFIHGAICVSQSGGCLMSSMIGKRSGNRGECAQPCRLPYKNGYSLSLKDMCLASHITEIIDGGIASLKIEGRMKDPAYVYAVTSVYRRLLDEGRNASDEELDFLARVFSRSGFTDAFLTGKLSLDMFGVRTDADKKNSAELEISLKQRRLPVKMTAVLDENTARVGFSYCGISVSADGEKPLAAENKPLTADDVKARLSKTGDSVFFVEDANVRVEGRLFVPTSRLNELRRSAIAKLEEAIIKSNTPTYEMPEHKPSTEPSAYTDGGTEIRVLTPRDVKASVFSDFANEVKFFDVPIWREEMLCDFAERYGAKTRAMLPRCVYPEDKENILALIEKARRLGIKALLCSSYAQKALAPDMELYADLTANIQNRTSLEIYKDDGFSGAALSPELNKSAVRALAGILPVSVCVYGRLPLMHSRACLIESTRAKRCGRDINGVCRTVLTDRIGADFEIYREYGHRSTLYNSVPVWLFDKEVPCGKYLIFTDESDARIKEIMSLYGKNAPPDTKATRGYY